VITGLVAVELPKLGSGGVEDTAPATAPTDEHARAVSSSVPNGARRSGLVQVHPSPIDEPPATWRVAGARGLGRSREAGIQLDDSRISRRQASVEPRQNGFLVRDEGSRHGTFVNGQPVAGEGTLARAGDVIRVGDVLLLAVEDVERFRARPRRSEGRSLGLVETMLAGPLLAEVWDEASRAAPLRDPVLILGESGSGKECVARILHSARPEPGPFVGINTGAIPEPLFEAELFGHERGAFTGAAIARPGAFREARNGVVFLDEVADLKAELQAKLLRVLDRGQVRPLGKSTDVTVNARVISATNRDLKRACELGTFRSDLYYRLSGIVIRVPPLRERRGDIVLLALEVLRERSPRLVLSADAAELLVCARWEGNARQLRHAVTQAANQALSHDQDVVQAGHLPELVPLGAGPEELTLERIQIALSRCHGVASHAARSLGVSRTTFYKALKRFGADEAGVRGAGVREEPA
jgi:DNA-binding NtrC family response regulator